MQKNLIILIIIAVLTAVSGMGIYYFLNNGKIADSLLQTEEIKVLTLEEEIEQMEKEYPQKFIGIINFLDDAKASVYEAVLKTDDGKEYILYPPQPRSIYESYGVENNGKVEIFAKPPKDNNLEWGILNPIN